jgi:segregation and condensation protein B
VTRQKSGKSAKSTSKRGRGGSTAPPDSGPATLDNIKAAQIFMPPDEPISEEPPTEPTTEPPPPPLPEDDTEPPTLDPAAEEAAAAAREAALAGTAAEDAAETPAEPEVETWTTDADADTTSDEGADADGVEDARELTRSHLRGLLEALVFASDKPMKSNELARLASAPVKQVKEALTELRTEYGARGIVLDEVAGGWLFRTNAQYAPFVRELAGGKPVKLSRAQVETLAIAAYRQPITRPEIDEIRGVDSGATLKLLLERDLVRILGKKDEPGRPLLYGTTTHFLEFFNMKSLRDLPTLREFTELSDESRRVAEAELGDVLPDMNPLPSALQDREPDAPTKPSFHSEALADDERDTIGPPPGGGDDVERSASTPDDVERSGATPDERDDVERPVHSPVAPSEEEWPDSSPDSAPDTDHDDG